VREKSTVRFPSWKRSGHPKKEEAKVVPKKRGQSPPDKKFPDCIFSFPLEKLKKSKEARDSSRAKKDYDDRAAALSISGEGTRREKHPEGRGLLGGNFCPALFCKADGGDGALFFY